MRAYVAWRLLRAIPTVFGVALLTFLLFNAFGPDPVLTALGPHASSEAVAGLRHQWGLDKPLPLQFLDFLRQIATFDYARSFVTGDDLGTQLRAGALVTPAAGVSAARGDACVAEERAEDFRLVDVAQGQALQWLAERLRVVERIERRGQRVGPAGRRRRRRLGAHHQVLERRLHFPGDRHVRPGLAAQRREIEDVVQGGSLHDPNGTRRHAGRWADQPGFAVQFGPRPVPAAGRTDFCPPKLWTTLWAAPDGGPPGRAKP
jgi:hypothetical protein